MLITANIPDVHYSTNTKNDKTHKSITTSLQILQISLEKADFPPNTDIATKSDKPNNIEGKVAAPDEKVA